jgi:hypothetical protein
MQPYPPNKSAIATNFKVGDSVKWVISETQISPYVGKVSEICPGINKIWVEMPVGGNQQFAPEDIILVPPEQGISPVQHSTGYSSFDKERSHKERGELGDRMKVTKLAEEILAKKFNIDVDTYRISKMASTIAKKFATDVVEKVAADILDCRNNKLTDIQAYQTIYKKYATKCSDGFIRHAIQKIYELK